MKDENNKVAIVSGGSIGLGLALCKGLLERGFYVATFSRKSTLELEVLSREFDGKLLWEAIDITDSKALNSFLKKVKKNLWLGWLFNQ